MSKSLFESKKYAVLLAIFYTFLWGLAFPLVFRWNYLVSVALICVGIIMVNRKGKSKGDI